MSTLAVRTVEFMPWQRWVEGFAPRRRRSAARRTTPTLVAHYWNGGAPGSQPVRDISESGFYLTTRERWYPGTLLMVTLQRTGAATGEAVSITVQSRVVREDKDGVAFAFVLPVSHGRLPVERPREHGVDKGVLVHFLKTIRADSGQALVEYILMLPFILILIVNVVNFGGFFYAWIAVANASRAAADYAIMGGSTVGAPAPPTATLINNVLNTDIAALPNQASLVVNICQNYNSTVTTVSGTCTSVPADPEAISYHLVTIDVTYTYVPFIPATFQFPGLNVYATLPPTSIHRRAVMRQE